MVGRVVFALVFATLPVSAFAIEPAALLPVPNSGPLPYDLTGFVVEPRRVVPAPEPQPEPAPPQVAARAPLDYRAENGLYDRTPDYLALSYDLTGLVPPLRRLPSYGPLDYELGGLLGAGRP